MTVTTDTRKTGLAEHNQKVVNWARAFTGVQDRYPAMASGPTATMGNANATLNANTSGNVTVAWDNSVLTHVGSTIIEFDAGRCVGAGVTFADSTKTASNSLIRTRFMTTANAIEAVFRGTEFAQVGLIVDGEYSHRIRKVNFPNDGNPHNVKFDLGADSGVYTLAEVTPSAGGSGYVAGDVITIAGGTFTTAATVAVTQVSSGAVSKVEVLEIGAYTVIPTGTLTQASTTGVGTGVTFVSQKWSARRATRLPRKIELMWHGSAQKFYGINIAASDVLVPFPVPETMPKIVFVGDSITNGTLLDYCGGHMGASIAQHLGLMDAMSINAIGGTGWVTVNTSLNPDGPMWSDALRVADFIAEAGDVYVWIGSQNDSAATSAEIAAAVTSTVSQVMAALPKSYHIGIGPVIATGATATTIATGVSNGFAALGTRRAAFIDNIAEGWLTGSGKVTAETSSGNKDFYLSSDGAHPTQYGLDYLAKQVAARVAEKVCEMANA